MQPGFHCQDHLEKKAHAQLLPQPQEGLTSHGLIRHPASDTALYVTASLRGEGGSGDDGDCWRFLVGWDDREQTSISIFLIVLVFVSSSFSRIFPFTDWSSVFSVSSVCSLRLSAPPLCPHAGKEEEGRAGKAHMEVQVKITTPDLSWTEPLPTLQNTHSHSILMLPRLPQCTGSHYYNSAVYDSPSLMERLWKIATWEELWGAKKKGNVWEDDNAWKGINLKILLVICLLQKYVT